jgi:aromatic-L-amino-acid/L-tryptophan decarboxylase
MEATEPSISPAQLGDLPSDEFTRHAYELVDWIARYLANVESYPVLSRVRPGEVQRAIPSSPPVQRESVATILSDFEATILPGITHWSHPGFFAYFATSSSAPGILAELLTAALNVNGMLWKTSPSATELEHVTLDWLRQLLGLEPGWFGMITDTASTSTLLALAAAREAKPELEVRERGMAGRADLPPLRVYTSEHSHSSVDKAVLTLGLGRENVVHVAVDAEFRMRPDALAHAVATDRAHGRLPLAAIATVGTTSTSSIDPVQVIAELCRREGMWLHVDAAYGGAAAVCPERRGILAGVDSADSLVVNPHKWLFVPLDLSVLYTRRPNVLKRAFSLVPDYLVTREQDDVVNYMDYGVALGRRFRSLKLWMVMRAFGADGLAARIREHCRLADAFADQVSAEPGWELMAPHPFSLVCFRYAPAGTDEADRNRWNEAILHEVNASGEVYLSHTKLGGAYTLRLAVGNIRTAERHVERAWTLLRESAGKLSTNEEVKTE